MPIFIKSRKGKVNLVVSKRGVLYKQEIDTTSTRHLFNIKILIIPYFLLYSHLRPQRVMSVTFTKPKKQITWLITGCSSGFGLSLARLAQAGGHKVIATSRNPSKTPDLVSEIESKGGKWIKLDVDDLNSAQTINDLEKEGCEVDALVNNAGYSIYSPIETSTEEEIRAQMESMYFGPLRLIRAVLPYMRKRRFGIIANMSSGASLDARDTMGPYAGAKAALDGMTVSIPCYSLLNEFLQDLLTRTM